MSFFIYDTLLRSVVIVMISPVPKNALALCKMLYVCDMILSSIRLGRLLCTAQSPKMTKGPSNCGTSHNSNRKNSCESMLVACNHRRLSYWRVKIASGIAVRESSKTTDR